MPWYAQLKSSPFKYPGKFWQVGLVYRVEKAQSDWNLVRVTNQHGQAKRISKTGAQLAFDKPYWSEQDLFPLTSGLTITPNQWQWKEGELEEAVIEEYAAGVHEGIKQELFKIWEDDLRKGANTWQYME